MNKRYQKTMILACLVGCLAIFTTGCDSIASFAAAPTETAQIPVVDNEGVVSAEGRLVPARSVLLSFASGGELGEIMFNEGDPVNEGDVLVRLGKTEPLEAARQQANFELVSAQQALDDLNEKADLTRQQAGEALVQARGAVNEAQNTLNNLDTQEFEDELDDLDLEVQDAKDELDDAQDELDKYRNLDPEHATRKNAQDKYDETLLAYNNAMYARDTKQLELDIARTQLDLANAQLAEAQREYENLANGPDPDSLALAQARLESARAQVAAAEIAIADASLSAPFSGTVVDLHDFQAGESVMPGVTVVTVADFSGWIVETRDLTELDVVDLEAGQEVVVVPDALPDLELTGTIESIKQVFTERSGDIVYTVRVKMDESDPRLRWGMTVNAVFQP